VEERHGHAQQSMWLAFASSHGAEARIEPFALEDAQAAYERMSSGDARFRVVLDVAGGEASS
jgi:D-arabinose 1-dehydrogenase-like Zn-dependent alcohol dehydrogenase